MRITNLPPSSTQVSTPSSTSARPVGTAFSARVQGVGAGASAAVGGQQGNAVTGRNVIAAAVAQQQASPNGAVASAFGLDTTGMSGLDASLAKMAKTPEQFAALKGCVDGMLEGNMNSIFSMGSKGGGIELEKD
jgi:hypothetical protein